MDSGEDSFIQLPCPSGLEDGCLAATPEQLRQEIERCKELCTALEQDHAKLQMAKEAVEQRTQELRKEGELLHKNLEQQMSLKRDEERSCQVDVFLAEEENNRLKQEKQVLKKKLEEVRKRVLCEDAVMMLPTLPEKKMVFKGLATNKEDMNKLMLTPLIRYPLLGGSALITFEKAEVAQRIIEVKEHMVELSYGEELEELDRCRVRVQAAPVDILLPSALEIGLTRSSRSILLSDLPSLGISEEALLDKLELFFSKTKNGGGEVESREFLDDSGQVVLTFAEDGVAGPLIARGHIQVLIGKGKYKLKISPCMSGDITNLQLQPSCCPRTVLLSGIPDVLAEEPMRDALEIHFQKASRGGGEVDALAYVPAGRQGVAVFMEDAG
ncbi:interferon-induced 35 kDa protein isoform X1 [Gymnogyps californianus]|uniref:interferon-induced 35 kDa protein isoform X1 n=1 Tax=Gymnogyps californianus TaxID=33616 RepID=UPI0021C6A4C5|nr:interferon-induced 35 kDa protein isoform X1 [Gymnogyps californianus]